MKTSTSLALLIFLIQLTALLPTFHCRVFTPMDSNLIDETCKKTPKYDLCESFLRSDERSLNATVDGLIFIMIDIIQLKAEATVRKINELLTQSPGDQQLTSCNDDYDSILEDDLPQASEALTDGDHSTTQDRLRDVSHMVYQCDDDFADSHPLKILNKDVYDSSDVAQAIAKSMLV